MKERFVSWKPTGSSHALLVGIQEILEEYRNQGYKLTLRQLYYQLVSRDRIANKTSEYKRIGNIVSRARLAGHIDWSMIEDRVRVPAINAHWDSPKGILKAAANSFYMPKWIDQDYYVEVWCEKDAVSNIIEPVCRKWDVIFMANRGYSSQTAMYDGFNRLCHSGGRAVLLYLGDHDPSGINMTDDIKNRLGTFYYQDQDEDFDDVKRLALNMDQVERYNPPANPAKVTDSRYKKYCDNLGINWSYGASSWELDALEPRVLSEIVEQNILRFLNISLFRNIEKIEAVHKQNLLNMAMDYKA